MKSHYLTSLVAFIALGAGPPVRCGSVTNCEPLSPRLGISAIGTNAVVSWPSFASNFVLEATANPAASEGWIRVTASPSIVGTDYAFTEAIKGAQRFYRLRLPSGSSCPCPGGAVDVRLFGAVGDGLSDDTAAFRKAIVAAANSVLCIAKPTGGKFRLTGTLDIASPMSIVSDKALLLFDFPLASTNTRLFNVTASNVTFDGLAIDATGLLHAPITNNRYAIYIGGRPEARLTNVVVKNCCFTGIRFSDGATPTHLVSHCIYNTESDGFIAAGNVFDAPSGAAVFLSFSDDSKIISNDIRNTGWYSIEYQQACNYAEIRANSISGTNANIRNWGGSINLMSDGDGMPRITHANIVGNHITGEHSYSTAINVSSGEHIIIVSNVIENVTQQTGGWVSYIRVDTRGETKTPANKGPSRHIAVRGNILIAGGTNNIGIYVDNQDYGVLGGVGMGEDFIATANDLRSPDLLHFFRKGIILHGQQGGWDGVTISNNYVQGIAGERPVEGLIGVAARTNTPVTNVIIVGNTLEFLGPSGATVHSGIALEQFIDGVRVETNSIQGFFYGVRSYANVSNFTLGTNRITGSTGADYDLASKPTVDLR